MSTVGEERLLISQERERETSSEREREREPERERERERERWLYLIAYVKPRTQMTMMIPTLCFIERFAWLPA